MERVLLNVGGTHFETFADTVIKYPDTLLGRMFTTSSSIGKRDKEIFFDRNPECFAAILEWYRTGWLEKPLKVSKQVFIHELEFWGIPLEPVVDNDNTLTVELKIPVENPRSLGTQVVKEIRENQVATITRLLNEYIVPNFKPSLMAKVGKSKFENLSVNIAITSVECSKSAEWDVHVISDEFFHTLQNSFGQDILRRILKKLDIEGESSITKTYVLVNRWTIYVDTVLIKCKLPDVPIEEINIVFKDRESSSNTGKANSQINRS